MKKLMAALIALAILAGCVPAALATSYMIFPTDPIEVAPSPSPTPIASLYVAFKKDSPVYNKAGGSKTGVVILKGSTAYANERSKDKKWVKILYGKNNAQEGWVPFKVLKKAKYDYPLINYASTSGDDGRIDLSGASKLAGTRFKVRVTADVYRKGSSGAKVIGRLKKGQSVKATGKLKVDASGVFFMQVKYKGKTGWMVEGSLSGASSAINQAILK